MPIDPEFVTLTPKAYWIAVLVEVQQISVQAFSNRVLWNFVERSLCEPLSAGEYALHPTQCRKPGTVGGIAVVIEGHGERTHIFRTAADLFIHRLPAQIQLTNGFFAQTPANHE